MSAISVHSVLNNINPYPMCKSHLPLLGKYCNNVDTTKINKKSVCLSNLLILGRHNFCNFVCGESICSHLRQRAQLLHLKDHHSCLNQSVGCLAAKRYERNSFGKHNNVVNKFWQKSYCVRLHSLWSRINDAR